MHTNRQREFIVNFLRVHSTSYLRAPTAAWGGGGHRCTSIKSNSSQEPLPESLSRASSCRRFFRFSFFRAALYFLWLEDGTTQHGHQRPAARRCHSSLSFGPDNREPLRTEVLVPVCEPSPSFHAKRSDTRPPATSCPQLPSPRMPVTVQPEPLKASRRGSPARPSAFRFRMDILHPQDHCAVPFSWELSSFKTAYLGFSGDTALPGAAILPLLSRPLKSDRKGGPKSRGAQARRAERLGPGAAVSKGRR